IVVRAKASAVRPIPVWAALPVEVLSDPDPLMLTVRGKNISFAGHRRRIGRADRVRLAALLGQMFLFPSSRSVIRIQHWGIRRRPDGSGERELLRQRDPSANNTGDGNKPIARAISCRGHQAKKS